MGWHGLDGDRRLALRRIDDQSGFPWLTASRLPELLLFSPFRKNEGDVPTHVRTPDGRELPVFGDELAAEIGRRHKSPVEMMQLRHGIFDDAAMSVIATDTIREITRLAGQAFDVRRFRPNVLLRPLRSIPFQEDEWVGGVLTFGDGDDAPAITVTMRDPRCSMVNLDPDSASSAPEMMKTVVRLNDNNAGKPEGIHLMIGRRPYAAFGNSTGDREMLEWTAAGAGARLKMLLLHDDAAREYAYGPAQSLPDTKVGTFTPALYDEAKRDGWTVISMKNDWRRVFAFK
jgi:hypothetical protein